MFQTDVFGRTGDDSVSRSAFYLVMGLVLAWGFVITATAAKFTAHWDYKGDEQWMFWVVGLGLPMLGILIGASGNWFISFIGFNLVAAPMGAVLGPVVFKIDAMYPGIVLEAIYLTAGVTGVMAIAGMIFPKFFSRIGGVLLFALIALLLVYIAGFFIPALQDLMWIHYAAAGLFALYVGYDMWRASTIPSTLDNAVDVSISLYLDIINLFLRILILMARSRGRS